MLARVGGDLELLAEISRLFVDDAPARLERIRASIDARDAEALVALTCAEGLGTVCFWNVDAKIKLLVTKALA